MRRWFLSYHSPDQALAERLNADAASRIFFAPSHMRAGGYSQRKSPKRLPSFCWSAKRARIPPSLAAV
jgi:hypothetical protein